MSLHDPVFLEFDGTPVTGRTPVRVVVEDGTPTTRQMAEVEAQYADFCTDKRLSKATYHDVERVLSDGSRVRMNSIAGVDTVYIRAADPQELEPFGYVAYTVTTDLEWADIFDRIVLGGNGGGPSPPGDPEPEFTVPLPNRDDYPKGGPAPVLTIRVQGSTIFDDDGNGLSSVYFTYTTNFGVSKIGSSVDTKEEPSGNRIRTLSSAHARYVAYWDDPQGTVRGDWTKVSSNTWESEALPLSGGGSLGKWGVLESGWRPLGGGIGPALTEDFSMVDAAAAYGSSQAAIWAAGDAAFEAAGELWIDQWIAWRDTIWTAWRDRIIGTPDPTKKPLVNLRRAGRVLQLESLRKSLDAGVSMPHLAARYLSFPFNITSKPNGELPGGPENAVVAGSPVGDHQDRHATYTLAGAVRESVVSENIVEPWDAMPFARDGVYRLGTDMADPKNLFGWQASGTFTRQAKYRVWHAAERAYVDPRNLGTLSFGTRPGYEKLLEKGVVISPDETTLTISTDGYVPAGTTITLVQLEYEVFDPYTEQWIWTPHVGITLFDSIWIKSLGDYEFVTLPEADKEGPSPRKIRVRRVLQQERKEDQSWTAPKEIPKDDLADKGVWEQKLGIGWSRMFLMGGHPTGVAIVEDLSPTVIIREGATIFPEGSVAVWPEWSSLSDVVGYTWEQSPSLYKLCAEALRITKKL